MDKKTREMKMKLLEDMRKSYPSLRKNGYVEGLEKHLSESEKKKDKKENRLPKLASK